MLSAAIFDRKYLHSFNLFCIYLVYSSFLILLYLSGFFILLIFFIFKILLPQSFMQCSLIYLEFVLFSRCGYVSFLIHNLVAFHLFSFFPSPLNLDQKMFTFSACQRTSFCIYSSLLLFSFCFVFQSITFRLHKLILFPTLFWQVLLFHIF